MIVHSLMKRIFNQKQLFKVLSLLLCICLIFFYCGIGQALTAKAVATEIVLAIIVVALASVGIGIHGTNTGRIIANKMYEDYNNNGIWDRMAEKWTALQVGGYLIGNSISLAFNSNEWQDAKSSIDSYLNDNNYIHNYVNEISLGDYKSLYDYLSSGQTLSIHVSNFNRQYNEYYRLSDTCTLRLCGSDVAAGYNYSDATADYYVDKLTAIFNFTGTGLQSTCITNKISSDKSFDFNVNLSVLSTGINAKCDAVSAYRNYTAFQNYSYCYYNTVKCGGSYSDSYYTLTYKDNNIVDNCTIGNVTLPDSCLDSTRTMINRSNFIRLLLGDDNVGVVDLPLDVDTKAYNDTWTNSDSVSINVPTTLDRAVSQTTAQARGQATSSSGSTGTNTADFPSIKKLSLPNLFFSKFPFCLPADLYNLFVGFVAEPEAPKFIIPFKFERYNVDEEWVVDFSNFSTVAKCTRFFSCAAAVYTLIILSRKLIGAGG